MRSKKIFFLILLVCIFTCGCATLKEKLETLEQEREIANLDKLYKEGKIGPVQYWQVKTELLNRFKKQNIDFQYNIKR